MTPKIGPIHEPKVKPEIAPNKKAVPKSNFLDNLNFGIGLYEKRLKNPAMINKIPQIFKKEFKYWLKWLKIIPAPMPIGTETKKTPIENKTVAISRWDFCLKEIEK